MSDCFDAAVQLVLAPAGAAPGPEVPVAAEDTAGHASGNAKAVARKIRFTENSPVFHWVWRPHKPSGSPSNSEVKWRGQGLRGKRLAAPDPTKGGSNVTDRAETINATSMAAFGRRRGTGLSESEEAGDPRSRVRGDADVRLADQQGATDTAALQQRPEAPPEQSIYDYPHAQDGYPESEPVRARQCASVSVSGPTLARVCRCDGNWSPRVLVRFDLGILPKA
jgi:hypothetical protein